LGGTTLNASLFRLASNGVCRAADVTAGPVSSCLTLSPLPRGLSAAWRFAFCGTFLGVTPTRRYLASCPAKLGLSSRVPKHASDHVNLSNRS